MQPAWSNIPIPEIEAPDMPDGLLGVLKLCSWAKGKTDAEIIEAWQNTKIHQATESLKIQKYFEGWRTWEERKAEQDKKDKAKVKKK